MTDDVLADLHAAIVDQRLFERMAHDKRTDLAQRLVADGLEASQFGQLVEFAKRRASKRNSHRPLLAALLLKGGWKDALTQGERLRERIGLPPRFTDIGEAEPSEDDRRLVQLRRAWAMVSGDLRTCAEVAALHAITAERLIELLREHAEQIGATTEEVAVHAIPDHAQRMEALRRWTVQRAEELRREACARMPHALRPVAEARRNWNRSGGAG